MPSAGIRFAGEAAFLVLVALGLGLARFDPIVIAAVMFVAWVLVALLERASAKEAARAAGPAGEEPLPMPPQHVERIDVGQAQPPVPAEPKVERQAEPQREPEPTVSERSARAILASGPPPLPREAPKSPPKPSPPRAAPPPPPPPPEPEPEREAEPEPEPVPVIAGPPREWNVWELQRAVRDAADDDRHEEWGALLIHLREFANADGDLPLEFDGLVRESFAPLLARPMERAATW